MTGPQHRSGRISHARANSVRARLSPRDVRILQAVEAMRLLQATQIQRAIFNNGSERTRARRARHTLQRLTNQGCLTRLERRIGGIRAGSAGYVYALTPFGQRILHPTAERLNRVREPSTTFADHILGIAEVWVALTEAEHDGVLRLVEFQAEPRCWRRTDQQRTGEWAVKPDAFAVVETGDWEHHWFIEVDRNTESRTVIARKADSYIDYWHTGHEQAATGLYPRILFLVPTEQRRQQIVDALASRPAEHWQLFQVAIHDDAVEALTGNAPGDDRGS